MSATQFSSRNVFLRDVLHQLSDDDHQLVLTCARRGVSKRTLEWMQEVSQTVQRLALLPCYDRTPQGATYVSDAIRTISAIVTDYIMEVNTGKCADKILLDRLSELALAYRNSTRERAIETLHADLRAVKTLSDLVACSDDDQMDGGPAAVARAVQQGGGLDDLHRMVQRMPPEFGEFEQKGHCSLEQLRFAIDPPLPPNHEQTREIPWERRMRTIDDWARSKGRAVLDVCLSATTVMRMQLADVARLDCALVPTPCILSYGIAHSGYAVDLVAPYHVVDSRISGVRLSLHLPTHGTTTEDRTDLSCLRWPVLPELLIHTIATLVRSGYLDGGVVRYDMVEPALNSMARPTGEVQQTHTTVTPDRRTREEPAAAAVAVSVHAAVLSSSLAIDSSTDRTVGEYMLDLLVLTTLARRIRISIDTARRLNVSEDRKWKIGGVQITQDVEQEKKSDEVHSAVAKYPLRIQMVMRRIERFFEARRTYVGEPTDGQATVESVGARNRYMIEPPPESMRRSGIGQLGRVQKGAGLLMNIGGACALLRVMEELCERMRRQDPNLHQDWHRLRVHATPSSGKRTAVRETPACANNRARQTRHRARKTLHKVVCADAAPPCDDPRAGVVANASTG